MVARPLTPGANIEVHGTGISYPDNSSDVVIIGSRQSLSFATITPPAVVLFVFTVDGNTHTADSSSDFVIEGQTLRPGSVITVSCTPISYTAGEAAVIFAINTGSLFFIIITPPSAAVTAAMLSFDGSIDTADSSSDFIIAGQAFIFNRIITVVGIPISYAAAGTAVIIGMSTEALSYATITPGSVFPTITFDGSTYTADTSKDSIVAGQTLAPGGVITVSGTPISYAAAGTNAIVGSSTEAVGIGRLNTSGFGGVQQVRGLLGSLGVLWNDECGLV